MNPLAGMIGGMQNMGGTVNRISQVMNLIGSLGKGSPEALLNNLLRQNPQAAQFMKSVGNKSPQQVCEENGINFNDVMNIANQLKRK